MKAISPYLAGRHEHFGIRSKIKEKKEEKTRQMTTTYLNTKIMSMEPDVLDDRRRFILILMRPSNGIIHAVSLSLRRKQKVNFDDVSRVSCRNLLRISDDKSSLDVSLRFPSTCVHFICGRHECLAVQFHCISSKMCCLWIMTRDTCRRLYDWIDKMT